MLQITRTRLVGSRLLAFVAFTITLFAACLLLVVQPARAATTFTVDSTADYADQTRGDGKCDTGTIMVIGGQCTLRAAIQEANAFPGADTINFDVDGTGVHTIAPTSELPKVTRSVTVNGYSQQGARANTKAVGSDAVLKIELNGANASGANGLEIRAANTTVKGLVVNQWSHAGVRIDGANATANKITGNYLGTDADGSGAKQGNTRGVYIPNGSENTIGGATPAARNVISHNLEIGISIDEGASGTRVLGNYIGTDASGTQDFGNNSNGINIEDASSTTIGGATTGERNVISGNDQFGISIYSSGTKVLGNYVGTDATGTKDLGNSEEGVYIGGPNSTVGGTTAAARNIISGNDDAGIAIQGAGANGNKVVGNYVGTDKSGTADLGNGNSGVVVSEAPKNAIGGSMAGSRNIISGNDESGIFIGGAAATGNEVTGNYVGTDASGTRTLKNSLQGVYVYFAPNNTIGGVTASARNVISGNNQNGISIFGTGATGNKVAGNYIGADASGSKVLGNTLQGVFVYFAPDNTIGGTTPAARNIVSGNGGDGVRIFGDGATGNRILSNSIFSNAGLGIDLGGDGPTPNDAGDTDAGPNYLQNFPLLSSARKGAAGATTIRGTLDSTPNESVRVEFFSNPKGTSEGKTLLGSEIVSTDASGGASFTFSTTKEVRVGQNITATATGPGGNTSEFSAPKQVAS